jgi:hypothetical protein
MVGARRKGASWRVDGMIKMLDWTTKNLAKAAIGH